MAPKVVKAMKVSNKEAKEAEKKAKEKAKEAKEKEKKEDRQWIAMAFSRVPSLIRAVPIGNLKDLYARAGVPWPPLTNMVEPIEEEDNIERFVATARGVQS